MEKIFHFTVLKYWMKIGEIVTVQKATYAFVDWAFYFQLH